MRALPTSWFLVLATLAAAAPVRNGPVAAELIAETLSIAPGQPFTVAVRLTLDPPWHAYWTNPGDSGLAPAIEWKLPDGFTAGELQFPFPRAIATPPFMTYGLEGDVWLLATITPPAELHEERVPLAATVDWLICDEYCVPGGAEVELTLPVGAVPAEPDPARAAEFAAARAHLPAEPDGWTFRARRESGRYVLAAIPPVDFAGEVPAAEFFPFAEDLIRHNAPQAWRRDGAAYRLELVPADPAAPLPAALAGVLVGAGPWQAGSPHRALRVDAPFAEVPPRSANPERNAP
ncbi:MAG TPA: protein-disulfide reductase DsbD family protein [Kiritimatiellia bacterium]|nr:protein-disulfide reductase DsbD family protein [Kiritimatiellia bacterium]